MLELTLPVLLSSSRIHLGKYMQILECQQHLPDDIVSSASPGTKSLTVSAKVVSFGDTESELVFEILTKSYLSRRTARVELYLTLLSPTRQGKEQWHSSEAA